MHNLCLIILATNPIFSDLMRISLPKLHMKLEPHPLKIFWAKVEKVQKTHKICIKYAWLCMLQTKSCLDSCALSWHRPMWNISLVVEVFLRKCKEMCIDQDWFMPNYACYRHHAALLAANYHNNVKSQI